MAATLRFPENITGSGTYMILTRYTSQGFTTTELRNAADVYLKASPISSYGLPVPNELSDSTTINYSDIEDTDIAGMVQSEIIKKSERTAQLASLALGTTNPNISTMLFNGVAVKTFTFNWNLVPESASEGNAIANIIQGLEEAKLPYFTSANQRLKFPDIFRISFGGVTPKLLKFMPAVITNIECNYAGGHFQLYKDGNFPQIQMSITFTEIVSRTREMQQRLYRR